MFPSVHTSINLLCIHQSCADFVFTLHSSSLSFTVCKQKCIYAHLHRYMPPIHGPFFLHLSLSLCVFIYLHFSTSFSVWFCLLSIARVCICSLFANDKNRRKENRQSIQFAFLYFHIFLFVCRQCRCLCLYSIIEYRCRLWICFLHWIVACILHLMRTYASRSTTFSFIYLFIYIFSITFSDPLNNVSWTEHVKYTMRFAETDFIHKWRRPNGNEHVTYGEWVTSYCFKAFSRAFLFEIPSNIGGHCAGVIAKVYNLHDISNASYELLASVRQLERINFVVDLSYGRFQ